MHCKDYLDIYGLLESSQAHNKNTSPKCVPNIFAVVLFIINSCLTHTHSTSHRIYEMDDKRRDTSEVFSNEP